MIRRLFSVFLLAVGIAAADTTTTNLGLTKPSQGSPNWGTKVNANYDIIDSSVAILSGNNVFTGSNTFNGVLNISSQSLSRIYLGTSTYSGSEILAVNGGAKFFGTNGAVVRLCDQNGINCQVLSINNSNPETGVNIGTITVQRIGTNLNNRSDISFGNSALPAGPSGSLQKVNTAIGISALGNYGWKPNSSQTGGGNVAVGPSSLSSLSYGGLNSAYGDTSCSYVTTGSYNICVGYGSGTGDGGGTETRIATSTILIGQYTGASSSSTHLTNAVAIGDYAKVNSSHSMVLGSKVGGGYPYDPFNVGIGTDTPRERLHIVGDFRVDDGSIYASSLTPGRCVETGANGLFTTSSAPCGSGGSGGSSPSNSILLKDSGGVLWTVSLLPTGNLLTTSLGSQTFTPDPIQIVDANSDVWNLKINTSGALVTELAP